MFLPSIRIPVYPDRIAAINWNPHSPHTAKTRIDYIEIERCSQLLVAIYCDIERQINIIEEHGLVPKHIILSLICYEQMMIDAATNEQNVNFVDKFQGIDIVVRPGNEYEVTVVCSNQDEIIHAKRLKKLRDSKEAK